jgi:hypothetical protein
MSIISALGLRDLFSSRIPMDHQAHQFRDHWDSCVPFIPVACPHNVLDSESSFLLKVKNCVNYSWVNYVFVQVVLYWQRTRVQQF